MEPIDEAKSLEEKYALKGSASVDEELQEAWKSLTSNNFDSEIEHWGRPSVSCLNRGVRIWRLETRILTS